MYESTRGTGSPWWMWLGWTLGPLAALGATASLAYAMARRRRPGGLEIPRPGATLPDIDVAEQRKQVDRDLRRAGRATARGLTTALSAAWDVAVGGADTIRTRAKVVPALAASAREAGASLGNAVVHAGGIARSFAGATTRTLVWLSLLGTALLYIYMPDPNQRDRFFARGRRYFENIRRTFSRAGAGRRLSRDQKPSGS